MIPTFRQWRAANRPDPIAAQVDRIHAAARQPLFTPTDKHPGDRVLGLGGVWSEVR